MEINRRPLKRYVSFSERAATIQDTDENVRLPSREDLTQEDNQGLRNFQNVIPPDDTNIRQSLIRWPDGSLDAEPDMVHPPSDDSLAKTILLPALVICLPIAALCAALLAIVYIYKADVRPNAFLHTTPKQGGTSYILVNFPASEC